MLTKGHEALCRWAIGRYGREATPTARARALVRELGEVIPNEDLALSSARNWMGGARPTAPRSRTIRIGIHMLTAGAVHWMAWDEPARERIDPPII